MNLDKKMSEITSIHLRIIESLPTSLATQSISPLILLRTLLIINRVRRNIDPRQLPQIEESQRHIPQPPLISPSRVFMLPVNLYVQRTGGGGQFTIGAPNIAPILSKLHSRLVGDDGLLRIDCTVEATVGTTAH